MSVPMPAGRGHVAWRDIGRALLAAYFVVAATWFAVTTLCAVVNFAWREPMFDQWREYEILLGLPFPQNVLQMMNGHRPILPNLVRIADVYWFGARQTLQIIVGATAAFLCAGALAFAAWNERGISRLARVAGVMVAVIGVLWLGNARRLLHGSEALNGYLPTLGAICAAFFVYRAGRYGSLGWLIAGCTACVLATFSFGLGLASFCALIGTALIVRLKWRRLLVPTAAFIGCLVAYVFVLPGNDGVRAQLKVEPVATIKILAEWIASPWKIAWLEHATMKSNLIGVSARAATMGLGIEASTWCVFLGLAGIGLFGALSLHLFRRPATVTRLDAVAAGAGLYALASGFITVFGRLAYLQEMPDQIYADRYLLWPSLFWCSLTLLAITRIQASRRAGFVLLSGLTVLPLIFTATQRTGAIWGAIVYRNAETTAAAVRSGIYDKAHFTGEDIGDEAHLREINLLRHAHLAMFADPAWQRIGTRWTGTLESSTDFATTSRWLQPVTDQTTMAAAGHFEGSIAHGVAAAHRGEIVALSAEDHMIAGLGNFSFISPTSHSLLLAVPSKRGFDGFVRNYDSRSSYVLALADFAANRAIVLDTLPATTEVPPGEMRDKTPAP